MKVKKIKPVKNSRLLIEQAEELSKQVFDQVDPALQVGAETPLRRASRALSGDYVEQVTVPLRISPGTQPSLDSMNKLFKTIGIDLGILEQAESSIEDLFVTLYNQVASKHSDLIGELRTAAEKIAALNVYNKGLSGHARHVVYNFTDSASVIQLGQNAVHDEEAGEIVLPIVSTSQLRIQKAELLGESNGILGNNFDRSRLRRGALELSFDNREETWFEYEKISNRPSLEPLRLIIKFSLEREEIINGLQLSVVNLGTAEYPRLVDIKVENKDRTQSIKPELSEENPDLSPRFPNFDKTNTLRFSPRRATGIIIHLEATEDFAIAGSRMLRKAIGLQEVRVLKTKYSPEGQFLLAAKAFSDPVISAGLEVQGLFPEDLSSAISLEASIDEGATWVKIDDLRGASSFELITGPKPFGSIQLRGRLSQKGATELIRKALFKRDIHTVIQNAAISGPISLEDDYIDYLEIIEGRLGQLGRYGQPYRLGQTGTAVEASQVFYLPYAIDTDRTEFRVIVNGESWSRVDEFSSPEEKAFLYKGEDLFPRIIFGDGAAGAIPPASAELLLEIDPQTMGRVRRIDDGVLVDLTYDSTKIKEDSRIFSIEPASEQLVGYAGPGRSTINLPNNIDINSIISITNGDIDWTAGTKVEFQNGSIEFRGLPEGVYWSINQKTNKIFLSPANGSVSGNVEVTYTGNLKKELTQWRFKNEANQIFIPNSESSIRIGRHTIEDRLETRVLTLVDRNSSIKGSIIEGSIRGVDLNGTLGISRILEVEVPFIDGASEFRSLREASASLLGVYSVDYSLGQIYLPSYSNLLDDDRGFLPGEIIWDYISLEAHYPIGRRLRFGSDYGLRGRRTIEKTPSYLDRVKSLQERLGKDIELNLRYNIKDEEGPAEESIEAFFTPVLKQIRVRGSVINPKIGAVLGD